MEGENKTADSLLESVTNTSSALSQLHEQQQQSKHRHEQEYTAVEEGDDQNGQQEGYTEEEKIELLEETIQDLRDRLSRATVRCMIWYFQLSSLKPHRQTGRCFRL
eukprot:gb/GECG01012571.1/.p1 GENE.gb/GECG01012571.1/~~gb/GECG01012571.1/.p1  ORF type:complete len:106 (+),score=20.38 gb/GECG01012571.1/:1-318(+)